MYSCWNFSVIKTITEWLKVSFLSFNKVEITITDFINIISCDQNMNQVLNFFEQM